MEGAQETSEGHVALLDPSSAQAESGKLTVADPSETASCRQHRTIVPLSLHQKIALVWMVVSIIPPVVFTIILVARYVDQQSFCDEFVCTYADADKCKTIEKCRSASVMAYGSACFAPTTSPFSSGSDSCWPASRSIAIATFIASTGPVFVIFWVCLFSTAPRMSPQPILVPQTVLVSEWRLNFVPLQTHIFVLTTLYQPFFAAIGWLVVFCVTVGAAQLSTWIPLGKPNATCARVLRCFAI